MQDGRNDACCNLLSIQRRGCNRGRWNAPVIQIGKTVILVPCPIYMTPRSMRPVHRHSADALDERIDVMLDVEVTSRILLLEGQMGRCIF